MGERHDESRLQADAAEHGIIVVCPDTSPRGDDVPDAADEYDFGKGAGFYVNATQEPWAKNYRMYAYIVDELPRLIAGAVDGADMGRQGIFGHSMGGHGALTIAFKNQDTYKSVSAFAPIMAPMEVPWGHKALGRYLGDDRAAWADYDACTLLRNRGWQGDILIDQGDADNFLAEQLRPALFKRPAMRPASTYNSACSPATTTPIISSPVLCATTSPGTRRGFRFDL